MDSIHKVLMEEAWPLVKPRLKEAWPVVKPRLFQMFLGIATDVFGPDAAR